jgi:recombinational DNA repair protein (RecF pathway)
MPGSTYFVQECSTCGRNLQVRVEYLGKRVVCQHCGAGFEAHEPGEEHVLEGELSLSMMDRADELIRQSGINLQQAGSRPRPSGVA